ncbi:hypothetical protein LAZ40_06750 [Cereibacter sphaeroides]|uniref:hypothetical protein n=1 Tax=Cereibacter sphaeroides TaxID=1063 RepID=UPI001F3F056C|nr:hypothetical protein [Cereibacter sphaeroides]MCE6958745.1 hypothetical protein [Cereibacter sphaeroides]MCE6973381.1 hypothetical protein [Cereibacter sphaeroides]
MNEVRAVEAAGAALLGLRLEVGLAGAVAKIIRWSGDPAPAAPPAYFAGRLAVLLRFAEDLRAVAPPCLRPLVVGVEAEGGRIGKPLVLSLLQVGGVKAYHPVEREGSMPRCGTS